MRCCVAFALVLLSSLTLHAAEVPMVIPEYRAEAERRVHRHRWIWDSLAVLRMNPQGALIRFRAGHRLQLWDEPGALYEQSFISTQAGIDLTPAYTRFGGIIEVQPLAVFKVWARYDYVASNGLFSYTRSFNTPRADYSDSTLAQTGVSYTAFGEQLTLGGLLQGKSGPWVVRNEVQFIHATLGLRDDHTVFFDGYLDMLFPNGGWGMGNEADFIYQFDNGFSLVLRYTVNAVFYQARHFGDGGPAEDTAGNSPTHRLGPVIVYTFKKKREGAVHNEPTVALLTQWWLRHRFRTSVAPAHPFMLIVLSQRGDLVPLQ